MPLIPVVASIPSEFTLLSNSWSLATTSKMASIPSEFTLLSNHILFVHLFQSASIPSEFTLLSNGQHHWGRGCKLQYPLNLHCSQTHNRLYSSYCGFNTLWIYTALKLEWLTGQHTISFNTLWIYTALKQVNTQLHQIFASIPSEFTLLSNLKFQILTYLRINPARLLHKFISLIITHFCLLF